MESFIFIFSSQRQKETETYYNLHENISNKNIAKLHAKDLAYL